MAEAVNIKTRGMRTKAAARIKNSHMTPVEAFPKYQECVFFVCISTLLSSHGAYINVTSSVREILSCSQVNTNITMKSRMLMAVARPIR